MQNVSAQLYDAITNDEYDRVKSVLLENLDELNAHTFMAGQTWLGYAAQAGKFFAVKALVDLGANVNIGDRTYNAKPLCSACDNANNAIAEYLIEHGSNLDTETSARNPLFAAIVGRSADCVRTVLNAGIDPTVRYNSDTMSDMDAVAFALMRGESECAEIIARFNAGEDELAIANMLAKADQIAELNAHP